MLSTPVIFALICLPGRMPYFLFSKQLPSLLSTDSELQGKGNVQHETESENLFLKAQKGNQHGYLEKKINAKKKNFCRPGTSYTLILSIRLLSVVSSFALRVATGCCIINSNSWGFSMSQQDLEKLWHMRKIIMGKEAPACRKCKHIQRKKKHKERNQLGFTFKRLTASSEVLFRGQMIKAHESWKDQYKKIYMRKLIIYTRNSPGKGH